MPRPLWTGFAVLATALALLIAGAGAAAAPTLPDGFTERTLATFPANASPVAVTWAPVPDGRMFIADPAGRVYVPNPGGPPSVNSLLLDISDHVNRGAANEDHGLLGIAADSDFAHFPSLYLLYTYEDGSASDGPKVSTLTRVTVTPDNHVGPETTLLGGVHTLKP